MVGSHLSLASGTTTFIAVYFDSLNQAPSSALLVLAGVPTFLHKEFGTAGRGAYTCDVASANSCRPYHFLFVDAEAKQWRYPDTGELVTFGEGNCATDYSTSTMLPVHRSGLAAAKPELGAHFDVLHHSVRLCGFTSAPPSAVRICASNGQSLGSWAATSIGWPSRWTMELRPIGGLCSGMYVVAVTFRTGLSTSVVLAVP